MLARSALRASRRLRTVIKSCSYSSNDIPLDRVVKNDLKEGQSIEQWATETDKNFMLGCYFPEGKRFANATFVKGEGAYLYDAEGKKYLDFTSGIAVTALGHCDPDWAKVVADQAATLVHTSNLYHTLPQLVLAKKLIELTPSFNKVFICNTGCEANEAALKFARRYAASVEGLSPGQSSKNKTKIISFKQCFHGRTMGALSLTYKPAIRDTFHPLIPNVHFLDLGDKEALDAAFGDDVAAVILEPVQGEGGIQFTSEDCVQQIRTLCDRHSALFIVDEVQCGLGRTGQLWAHQLYDVEPDVMTLAKPLAGGIPIGAVMLKDKVAATIRPGDHGTTFGGNPLACAAAYHTLNRIADKKFLEHVQSVGTYLIKEIYETQMKELPHHIGEVRWPGGLMVGIDIVPPVRDVIERCAQEGLLIISAGTNTVRIVPALNITTAHVDEFMKTFKKVLKEFKVEVKGGDSAKSV